MENKRADLHIHTVYSDGTDDLDTLINKIRQADLSFFSITDHDTISGSQDMMKKKMPEDITFIPGAEFSCITAFGDKCHILGYGFDFDHPSIQAILEEGHQKRRDKFQFRIDALKERYGIVFSDEAIARFQTIESVGKPHLAQEIVNMGVAGSIQEAIQTYLNPIKTSHSRIDAQKVICAIMAADGISVWAHPLGGEGEPHITLDNFNRQFENMVKYGIQGLECWYSRFSLEEIQILLGKAREKGLLISGGSDYHGTNKTIPLGTLNAEDSPVMIDELDILKIFLK